MIRNYTPGGDKWSPSKIVRQTSPLSCRCETLSGNTVKCNLDQIITRSVPSSLYKSFCAAAASDTSNEPVIPMVVPLFSPLLTVVEPTSDSFLSPRVKRPLVRLD